jgi:hypothetical protein
MSDIYIRPNISSGGGLGNSFETVSKNLSAYPFTLTYSGGDLSAIEYDLGGSSITKAFNYSAGALTSIVLSGATPAGISLTKEFNYTGDDLTSVVYS